MMRSVLASGFALGLACVAGCGDDGPGDNMFADGGPTVDAPVLPDSSVGPDGPLPDASPPDARPPIDAPINSSGPGVEIIQPTAPSGFGSDEIVISNRFTVRCEVTQNSSTGDPVDASSVRVTVFGLGGTMREAFAQPTTVADVYEATLSVGDFLNGPMTIRCTASDLANPPRTNSDEVETYLDLGPQITVFSPIANASYANQVEVIFRVAAAPVDSGDSGAAPDFSSVTMSIAGVDLSGDLVEDPPSSGVFRAAINFEDNRFDPSLEGAQTVTVSAANTRTPAGVTRVTQTVFLADSEGPVLDIVEPAPAELVGGIFSVTVEATDPAGIDDSSVVATIAGVHEFDLINTSGDEYVGSFDTRVLPRTMVFPTLVVRARDAVGNQTSIGQIVTLDNRPPLVHMDPPDIREAFTDGPDADLLCSHPFDPLGDDATNDIATVSQLFEPRARVEDRGNGDDPTDVFIPIAGVNPNRVQLFVLDDSSRALIVDTDGDPNNYCDEINPVLVPTSVPMASNEAAVVDLFGLEEQGDANFVPPAQLAAAPVWADCNEPNETQEPLPLCDPFSFATRIPSTEIGDTPIVYAIPPQTDLSCMGNAFDALATNIGEGPACLAVRAVDNLGNVGVSPPLRVCIDYDGDGSACPLPPSDDCTGTYDPMTGTTDDGLDCVPPPSFGDFPGLQIRRNDL